ncbi:MAG: hypothetical protein WC284_14480, partial [Candidimonas sp.]
MYTASHEVQQMKDYLVLMNNLSPSTINGKSTLSGINNAIRDLEIIKNEYTQMTNSITETVDNIIKSINLEIEKIKQENENNNDLILKLTVENKNLDKEIKSLQDTLRIERELFHRLYDQNSIDNSSKKSENSINENKKSEDDDMKKDDKNSRRVFSIESQSNIPYDEFKNKIENIRTEILHLKPKTDENSDNGESK